MQFFNNKLLQLAFKRSFDLKAKKIQKHKIVNSKFLLISCLRNEGFRLNFFLNYYRKLGIEHFLIIDNDSNDETSEILNEDNDVSFWVTKKSATVFGPSTP